MLNVISKILGSANDRLVKSYDKTVSLINDLEPKYHAMTDDELRAQTDVLRGRLAAGEKEKNILPDAFALVREASIRAIGLRHFNVQMIGGMVLTNGQIAEMKTGEGKTLVATLALFYAVGRWNGYSDALMYINKDIFYPLQLFLYNILNNINSVEVATQEGFSSPGLTESLKAAIVMFSTVPILCIYPWLQKYFIHGVTMGAVKE